MFIISPESHTVVVSGMVSAGDHDILRKKLLFIPIATLHSARSRATVAGYSPISPPPRTVIGHIIDDLCTA